MELKFFKAFINSAFLINATDTYNVYSLEYNNVRYTVLKTLKKANKRTVIRTDSDRILWEQYHLLFNRPPKDVTVISLKQFASKGTIGIVVINGTPLRIIGLDENGYISINRKVINNDDIYVMTYLEFKNFIP